MSCPMEGAADHSKALQVYRSLRNLPAMSISFRSAHDARAWLVDYVATCHRDAAHASRSGDHERAATLTDVADDLSTMLQRWDIATDGHTPP